MRCRDTKAADRTEKKVEVSFSSPHVKERNLSRIPATSARGIKPLV
jgi:hypothetical protein